MTELPRDCIFCRIIAGREPASLVLDTPNVLVFVDVRQSVSGHVLIVPRRHVETLYELDAALAEAAQETSPC